MAEIFIFLNFGKKKKEEENELQKFQNLRFGILKIFYFREPLLGQIQIAKAATYTERCAKMSTLRKKGILGKVKFMKFPVHFFLFLISQEKV